MVSLTFEDLEVVLGRPIRLDLESLQTTMVRRRRGGTCREQILLCAAALDAVGFTFTASASRVRLGEDRIRPATHMSLRVDIGGEGWFTNVGFGAESLLEPLRLRDGEAARQAGGPPRSSATSCCCKSRRSTSGWPCATRAPAPAIHRTP
ncbi:arylamine N-acetyltransferase family protein [Streptomyces noursei]|uniref:arylamine N-acetyltransferase family protein n=1 Tax=Streptomyces noursei TaxID=1971 RepID=UPI0030F0F97E